MKNKLSIILLVGLLAVLASCTNKEDDVNPQPAQDNITFSFIHTVGSQVAQFNTIAYSNAFGNPYSVETLQYFISDITLYRADGTTMFFDDEHYIDGKVESTLTFVPDKSIPSGEYIRVTFIFGLNEAKNVNGAFPNPPENNMEWPPAMGTGYHYMKLEGKHDSTGVIKNYQAHAGPTMGNQNYFLVDLPNSGFFAAGDGIEFTIAMNINNWWVSPNTIDLNDMTMIMGDQTKQVQLRSNGMEDAFSVFSVN